MFFNFSSKKVLKFLGLMSIIFSGIIVFLLIYPNINVTYISDFTNHRIDKAASSFSYWWSFKVLKGDVFAREFEVYNDPNIAQSIPVLLYHGESEEAQDMPVANFVDHMRTLKENGWQSITLDDFYAFMKGDKNLPNKSFLLTFDDGRKDSYYPADPVLRDYGFNAVMFVITGFSISTDPDSKSNFYLSRLELDQMNKSGRWALESHGKEDHHYYFIDADGTEGHFLSNKLWIEAENRLETDQEFRDRITQDLSESKEALENAFGRTVESYAYPFSDYGQDSINFSTSSNIISDVVSSVYRYAYYQAVPADGDTFNYPDLLEYRIKRIEPLPSWTGQDLMKVLEAGQAKILPYEQESFFGEEWIKAWWDQENDKSIQEALVLQSSPKNTGASVSLNGSGFWQDYSFKAIVDWQSGDAVMLAARYKNARDFLFCAFSDNSVAIRQNKDGIITTLINTRHIINNSRENIALGVTVENDEISCFINDSLITETKIINSGFEKGGIGIQIWDEQPGNARAVLKKVQVFPLE